MGEEAGACVMRDEVRTGGWACTMKGRGRYLSKLVLFQ